MRRVSFALLTLLVVSACTAAGPAAKGRKALPAAISPTVAPDPAPYTGAPAVVLTRGTVMTAAGDVFSPGYVVLRGGRIVAVGAGEAAATSGATLIDASGMYITPGVIDTHSHMGVYALPGVDAHEDGNELTRPTTPEVWAEHGFWPQDPSLFRAVAKGGVTTVQVLPGSGNLIGGRSFVAKLRPSTSARLMRFPGAPQGLKMACGENPKRVYGSKGAAPMTRMGNVAGFRRAFQEAVEYRRHWLKYDRDLEVWKKEHAQDADNEEDPPEPPERDLSLETLAAVLDGDILVQNHCYRADEMHIMLDLAQEFGFEIRSFHHGLEAYKLRDRLAQEGVAVSTWADWWGFKLEAFDGIPQNAALLTQAGVRTVIHSDSETEICHLNQEAAKAVAAGRKIGVALDDNDALRWITANPAWVLGIEDETGTLEVGKMADVVVWDRHPLSVYARPRKVFIDGDLVFDRDAPNTWRRSDFELGLVPTEGSLP
jgi:imidazolonepropionase-like amidohydrolase